MTVDLEQLSCQELVELVTGFVEGALAPDERERIERHLDTCDGCRTYVEQMRQVIELTGRLTLDDVPPEAERALLEAFRGWRAS
ncbi:MAG TPA: zf-HC2 domain-containing protein [Gaiellaceae bacterium]|nr:zf-HC2 domain-containing protein [Gaiellaceae bacterium]